MVLLAAEGEVAPVGRPGQAAQRLGEPAVRHVFGAGLQRRQRFFPAAGQLQHPDLRRMAAPGGEKGHPAPVGRNGRAHIELRDVLRTARERGAVNFRFLQVAVFGLCQVLQLGIFLEFSLEPFQVRAYERVQHRAGFVAAAEQFQHPARLVGAVLLGEEPDGLAAGLVGQRGLVGLEVAELVQTRERDQPAGQGGVAHVHLLHGVVGQAGLVLGYALHHPERVNESLEDARAFPEAVYQHAELHFVRELVLHHVLEPAFGTVGPDHEAVFERFGEAAYAVGNVGHVGLLHVVDGGVEEERQALGQGRVQVGGLALVGGLQHPGGVVHPGLRLVVVVDVEMLGGAHLPLEVPDEDLVLLQSAQGRGGEQQGGRG